MSRIQDILDKAEREGSLRRVQPVVAPPPAAALAYEERAAIASDADLAADAAEVPSVAHRMVTGTTLDRLLVAAKSPTAIAAEQYRALRTRILHADHGAPVHAILITSPTHGEGKSITAANLALTMGQEVQRRVCLVDANLRQSRVSHLFGVPTTPGLADVLLGRATLDEALVTLEDHNVTLLPAGTVPAGPAELLGSTAMRRLLDTLRSQFDRVIIDASPAAPLADVGILAPLVDSVLLVVRSGVTTKPAIHAAVTAVDGANLLGIVLNESIE